MPQVVSASFGEEDCIEQYIMDEGTKRVWGTDRCRSKLLCYVALSSCIVQRIEIFSRQNVAQIV